MIPEAAFSTVNVAVSLLGKNVPSPLYFTSTVLSPAVNPGTFTVIMPSTMPTVCVNSSPILMVTFPVAFELTVMFMTATSPREMLSTSTVTVDWTLDTLKLASP